MHADRGWPERSHLPELPRAAGGTRRTDDRSWAAGADSGTIMDGDARGEPATGDLGVGTFDAQLTRADSELVPGGPDGIRPCSRVVHDLRHDCRGAGGERCVAVVGRGERMTADGQRGGAERGAAVNECDGGECRGAVAERDGAGGDTRRRGHRRAERDGLPGGGGIRRGGQAGGCGGGRRSIHDLVHHGRRAGGEGGAAAIDRSEEHTSELQSPCNLVCRLLLEKKKNIQVLYKMTAVVRASSPLRYM